MNKAFHLKSETRLYRKHSKTRITGLVAAVGGKLSMFLMANWKTVGVLTILNHHNVDIDRHHPFWRMRLRFRLEISQRKLKNALIGAN